MTKKLLLLGALFAMIPAAMANTWYGDGTSGSDNRDCDSRKITCAAIGGVVSSAALVDAALVDVATDERTPIVYSELTTLAAGTEQNQLRPGDSTGLETQDHAGRPSAQRMTQVCQTSKFKLTVRTTIACVGCSDRHSALGCYPEPEQHESTGCLKCSGSSPQLSSDYWHDAGLAFVAEAKQEVVLKLGKRGHLGLQDAWVMVSVSGYEQE